MKYEDDDDSQKSLSYNNGYIVCSEQKCKEREENIGQ